MRPRSLAQPPLFPPGAETAVTMPVTFALLLLLSQATADPCYDPQGHPRFCLPPVTQLAAAAASCPHACTLSPGNHLDPGETCNGSLTLALGGPFLLTSVSLRFCTSGPPALILSAAWAAGGPWRLLWQRPAWPGALGSPERVTFRSTPGSKSTLVASHLRIEFRGQARLAAAGLRGRCQCHGHAARCAARARPPRCRCRHHTTGPGCESCRPSHRDRPWRPATPQHPHPCLRESWAPHSPHPCLPTTVSLVPMGAQCSLPSLELGAPCLSPQSQTWSTPYLLPAACPVSQPHTGLSAHEGLSLSPTLICL
ncbi:Netrin-5 [Saguinus oedipus]|uniref:Netrin-5 n=1 Tax=Saguinus oedipus TaxID=9490 RepID=A0ABQ9TVQ9_SAGOE|nr:Netrin-5 [Saguinus oedipus]